MINDGGPAFPTTFQDWNEGLGGMTLRDYFAAKALTAAMTGAPNDRSTAKSVSDYAYHVAEAMLAEKKRREAEDQS